MSGPAWRLVLAVLALAGAGPAQAAGRPPLAQSLQELQADDARLLTIGFHLARANAGFCGEVQPSIGLMLLDVRNFADSGAVRTALHLPGDFAVDAVAAGSPAQAAGLTAGSPVLAVDGEDVARLPASQSNDVARLAAVHARIEAALGARGTVGLTLPDRTVALAGVPACRSRFELVTGSSRASADGDLVQIGRKLLARARSDDEAAFLVGHELAHNLLGHRARLSAGGRTIAAIRDTEREADRLAVWLMANAGYDPGAGAAFLRHWKGGALGGLLQEPSHDRAGTRARLVEAEIAAIAATPRDAGGRRDWRAHLFAERRLRNPDEGLGKAP